MNFNNFVKTLDEWGEQKIPFFFLVDFEQKKPIAFRLEDLPPNILYNFNGKTNEVDRHAPLAGAQVKATPIQEDDFRKKFDFVHRHLEYGDSYLTNLTVKTEIESQYSFKQLFNAVGAKYKLSFKDEFLVFSPEIFVQIKGDEIFSFPMKGTIDASVPEAASVILSDQKELAEHVTIVDLIRNDLSLVADNVLVARFRYLDTIISVQKQLLQVSSEIKGKLFPQLTRSFGTILNRLLPAGSISGAPKKKTVEIIQQAEGIERGYYTGVAGVFDGNIFDSGVLIRFIEKTNGKTFYRSGGGITTASDWKKEYREVIDKIYVPLT
jgi:para-aminobenzoate synthetase component I